MKNLLRFVVNDDAGAASGFTSSEEAITVETASFLEEDPKLAEEKPIHARRTIANGVINAIEML